MDIMQKLVTNLQSIQTKLLAVDSIFQSYTNKYVTCYVDR